MIYSCLCCLEVNLIQNVIYLYLYLLLCKTLALLTVYEYGHLRNLLICAIQLNSFHLPLLVVIINLKIIVEENEV